MAEAREASPYYTIIPSGTPENLRIDPRARGRDGQAAPVSPDLDDYCCRLTFVANATVTLQGQSTDVLVLYEYEQTQQSTSLSENLIRNGDVFDPQSP